MARFVVPGWWPIAVSIVLSAPGWGLTAIAAVTLGGWLPALVVGWVVGMAAIEVIVVFRKYRNVQKPRAELGGETDAERVEKLRTSWARIRSTSRYSYLKSRLFWTYAVVVTGPKTPLITYGLTSMGLPLPAAAAIAAVPVVWLFVGRMFRNNRLDPAMRMLIGERPAGGLPTFEV